MHEIVFLSVPVLSVMFDLFFVYLIPLLMASLVCL